MRIMFVRHGLTMANITSHVHSDDTTLAFEGENDARNLALKLACRSDVAGPQGVGALLTSPLRRARQTADAIAEALHLPITVEPLLRERILPRSLEHLPEQHERYRQYLEQLEANLDNLEWRYEEGDEENMQALVTRVTMFLEEARQRELRDAVCVTHRGFLRTLLAVVLCGPLVTPRLAREATRHSEIGSTAMVQIEWRQHGWALIGWNV